MSGALDPAVALALRAGFALLFASTLVHKLRAPADFRAAVGGFGLVPRVAVGVSAAALAAGEAAVVVALIVRPAMGGMGAALLLLVYAAAMALVLLRGGGGVDCGCGGVVTGGPVRGSLVGRNLVLAALALPLLVPVGPRPLAWLDAVTVVGAVAVGAALVAAVGSLLVNGPRIDALRRVAEDA